jgi:hypothetical protein
MAQGCTQRLPAALLKFFGVDRLQGALFTGTDLEMLRNEVSEGTEDDSRGEQPCKEEESLPREEGEQDVRFVP